MNDYRETPSGLLVGLDVALKHPEWARALVDALNAAATEEELRDAADGIRAFVEACPVTFEHEPQEEGER